MMMGKYQSYLEYKNSGVDWIGDIPRHWKLTRIKFITECLDGARIPLNAQERGDMQGKIPYWGSNKVVDYVNDFIFDEELLLLGEDGAPFFDATKDVAFNVSGKIWPNNHVHVLRPEKRKVESRFLKYAINCADFHLYISGSTRDKLNQSDMNEIYIRSCQLHEQESIANFLDYETAKIDNLIEKQQHLIKLLKEKRQAVISHAVTKGLNPDALMKDSGVEWLGEVPEHWAVKRLKNVLMESMKNGLFKKKDQFGTGSLLVNVSDLYVDDYFIKLNSLDRVVTTAEEQKIYKVEIGDIFFVRSSLKLEGIGRSACLLEEHEDVVFECHVVKARPSKISTTSKYLVRYLNSPLASQEFIRRSKTTTMTTIDQDNLTTINVVVPPRNEQVLIDSYLDRQLMKIDQADSLAKESMKLYIERRKALISATVTGKIDVRNWKLPEQNKTNKQGTV